MNLNFSTNFLIMPGDCNSNTPLIFGGALFSKMDIAAASCVNQALYGSECNTAVTHKFEGTFHAPSYLGDIVYIEAVITEMRHKSITIEVKAHKISKPIIGMSNPQRMLVATAIFVFVTMKDDKYWNHGLVMENSL